MEPSEVIKPYILSILRRALQSAAGWLVLHGYLNDGQTAEIIVGIAGFIAVEATIIYSKLNQRWKINAALTLPPTATYDEVKAKAAELRSKPAEGGYISVALSLFMSICMVIGAYAPGCSKADQDKIHAFAKADAQTAILAEKVAKGLKQMHDAGQLSDAAAIALDVPGHQFFDSLTKLTDQIQAASQNPTDQAAFDRIGADITECLKLLTSLKNTGALHIKSATSQAAFDAVMISANIALTTLQTAYKALPKLPPNAVPAATN